MSAKNLSENMPAVKVSNGVHLENSKGKAAVSTLEIAAKFGKRHCDVLRLVHRLIADIPEDFHKRNFALMVREVEIGSGAVRQDKYYLLTRDAFSLVAMGLTGRDALAWKLRYIEAFNSLERAALESREEAYLAGLAEGRKSGWDGLLELRKIIGYRKKGLSCREIGKILGITKGAVEHRLVQAKKLGAAI